MPASQAGQPVPENAEKAAVIQAQKVAGSLRSLNLVQQRDRMNIAVSRRHEANTVNLTENWAERSLSLSRNAIQFYANSGCKVCPAMLLRRDVANHNVVRATKIVRQNVTFIRPERVRHTTQRYGG